MVADDLKLLRVELVPGTRVGAYEVEDVRARLPHVVIHRARHIVTGRPVALQVLRPLVDPTMGGSLRTIRRDLAALNRLRHAHVAEILETGELGDGRPFLVVEWVAGRSLQTLLDARVRLPVDEALPIADEIGAALAEYVADVRAGAFPEERHTYGIAADELARFEEALSERE